MAKIAHYLLRATSRARLGLVHPAGIIDLADTVGDAPASLIGFLGRGGDYVDRALAAALERVDTAVPLSEVRLLPPVARPGKIICLGLNYADHAAEGGNARPSYPSFFLRHAGSLVAHRSPIVRPHVSTSLDFEAELAVIIGKRCRYLTQSNALEAVAGYSCFNDATLRDYQRLSTQWTIGKNFDNTGAFGPYFVQASDLPEGASGLKIESRLNGRVMQSGNTADMLFGVNEALRLISEVMTLDAGDVIMMGTPAGVGYARKPPVWMQPADTIEIEIEGIGTLSNTIVQESSEVARGSETDVPEVRVEP